METIITLITGLFGGVAVVFATNMFSREKTKAEIRKISQETEYLKAQTDKINGDVSVVKVTQVEQESDLDALSALFVISDWQRNHLEQLSKDEPFPFEKRHSFETELRHLRMLGLIENLPGKTVSNMPHEGDLKEFFRITNKGREYLALVQRITQRRLTSA
jgi:hypothetical protein